MVPQNSRGIKELHFLTTPQADWTSNSLPVGSGLCCLWAVAATVPSAYIFFPPTISFLNSPYLSRPSSDLTTGSHLLFLWCPIAWLRIFITFPFISRVGKLQPVGHIWPMPVSVNKDAHCFTYYLWLLSFTMAELNSLNRDPKGLQSQRYLLSSPLQEKLVDLWFITYVYRLFCSLRPKLGHRTLCWIQPNSLPWQKAAHSPSEPAKDNPMETFPTPRAPHILSCLRLECALPPCLELSSPLNGFLLFS